MKAVRLLQIVIVLAAAAYLALLFNMNDVNVVMPFLPSLHPAFLLVAALLIGWLLGWLPSIARGVRRGRELRRLRRRVAELEQQESYAALGDPETPVIPDRRPVEPGEVDERAERTERTERTEQEQYDRHENL